jgi:hypothetical protein
MRCYVEVGWEGDSGNHTSQCHRIVGQTEGNARYQESGRGISYPNIVIHTLPPPLRQTMEANLSSVSLPAGGARITMPNPALRYVTETFLVISPIELCHSASSLSLSIQTCIYL